MPNRVRSFFSDRVKAIKAVREHGLRYHHFVGASAFGIKHVVEQLEQNESLLRQNDSDLLRNGKRSTIEILNGKGQRRRLSELESEKYRYKKILELQKLKTDERNKLIICKEKIRQLLSSIIDPSNYNINETLQRTFAIAIANAIKTNAQEYPLEINGYNIKIRYSKQYGQITFRIRKQGRVIEIIDKELSPQDAKAFTDYGKIYTQLRTLILGYKNNKFTDPEYFASLNQE